MGAGCWWQGRLTGFDLETTGVDPEEARIVTAALAIVGGGEESVQRAWLADPGVEIPDQAAEIHGVTTARARAEGQAAAEVVREVRDRLAVASLERRPVVIFNARYDLTVLDRECRRHHLRAVPDLLVIDPLVIDKHLDKYRRGSRKLEAVCVARDADLDGAHEAYADALAACRLAYRIGQRGEIVRRVFNAQTGYERKVLCEQWESVRNDLQLLHDAQVKWAYEQAVGLAQHFRSKGDPAADTVRTEWPVVSYEARAADAEPEDAELESEPADVA